MLGAGADVVYGVPTIAQLLPKLAAFVKGDGAEIHETLKKKLPRLRFTFDKYAGDQGDVLLTQLFDGADGTAEAVKSAAVKLKSMDDMKALASVLDQLCAMAEHNTLSADNLVGLGATADEAGGAAPLIDPKRMSLSEIPAKALRAQFRAALTDGANFNEDERKVMAFFIEATNNVEELLSSYFTLYCAGRNADRKTYLYLSWMLWAFLRSCSTSLTPRDSIYSHLPAIGGNVITFNYTNFFSGNRAKSALYFHGSLDSYLRLDDRELVEDDPKLRAATNLKGIQAFLKDIRLTVEDSPAIDMPAIVPPISFKPVMSRGQLNTWARCDQVLQQANTIIVVGYSFATADEHFNDLIRKTPKTTRILVVNPDTDKPLRSACSILGTSSSDLQLRNIDGFDVWASQRLTFTNATADHVSKTFVETLLA